MFADTGWFYAGQVLNVNSWELPLSEQAAFSSRTEVALLELVRV